MASSIKVSIIIPVYNSENYIKRCLDSLINQTLRGIEIIIVDDGSNDSSGAICDKFALADERISVFHICNSGPSYARNFRISKAKGEYIGFVDSDDYVNLEMFEKLYNLAST